MDIQEEENVFPTTFSTFERNRIYQLDSDNGSDNDDVKKPTPKLPIDELEPIYKKYAHLPKKFLLVDHPIEVPSNDPVVAKSVR
jgi:hypothetical protein